MRERPQHPPHISICRRILLAVSATALGLALACGGGGGGGGSTPPPAGNPAISSFEAAQPPVITAGASTTLTATFANGTGEVTPGGLSITSGTPVTVHPASDTIYTLKVTNSVGVSVTQTTEVKVVAAPVATITAPAKVTAGRAYTASVPEQTGSTYAWTLTGATPATSSNREVTFTPGATGTVGLTCVVTNAAGTASDPGSGSCAIVAAAVQPTITAPNYVTVSDATGYTASTATIQPADSNYLWTITGGTISGSATGTSVHFLPGATLGSLTLTCTVSNSLGDAAPIGVHSTTIVAAPAITHFGGTPSTVVAGQDTILSWTLPAGSRAYRLTGSDGTDVDLGGATTCRRTVPGTTTYHLQSVNEASTLSTWADATVTTIAAAPHITSFTATGTTLTAVFEGTGATGIINPGGTPITSGGTYTPAPAMNTVYTLIVSNAVGSVSAKAIVVVAPNNVAIHVVGLPDSVTPSVVFRRPSGPESIHVTDTNIPGPLPDGTYSVEGVDVEDGTAAPLGGSLSPTAHLAYHAWNPTQSFTVTGGVPSVNAIEVVYPEPTKTVQLPDVTHPGSSIPMEFVLVPAGTFTMGSASHYDSHWLEATPTHTVTIDHAFYMAKYPCTQAQWQAVTNSNPSMFPNHPTHPVEQVSWNAIRRDSTGYLDLLKCIAPGHVFRLPSEAEYEYAVRAGTTTDYFFGDSIPDLATYAWYEQPTTLPVGLKAPNQWGLYDIIGNVFQWCEDDSHGSHPRLNEPLSPGYAGAPADGSAWIGTPRGTMRVLRGGGWYGTDALSPRSGFRYDRPEDNADGINGFRLVMNVPAP